MYYDSIIVFRVLMLTKTNIPVPPVAVGSKIKKLLVGTQSCSIQLTSRINGEKMTSENYNFT